MLLRFQHDGKLFFAARVIFAGIKILLGEPDTWWALQKEIDAKAQRIRDKKKRNHQKHVEVIKEAQVEAPISQPALIKMKATPVPESAPQIGESLYFAEAALDLEQEKLNKQKRHEEAQRKRELQEDRKELPQVGGEDVSPEPLSSSENREARLQNLLASSDVPLHLLYDLSGTPLKVDEEIETGTWRFTRENLQLYFETMGCEYKPNSTGHRKVDLPSAMHVMQGGDLVTIFNEFGGALPLPAWEKDYVPAYLKVQILKAREKLRALKIMANNLPDEQR